MKKIYIIATIIILVGLIVGTYYFYEKNYKYDSCFNYHWEEKVMVRDNIFSNYYPKTESHKKQYCFNWDEEFEVDTLFLNISKCSLEEIKVTYGFCQQDIYVRDSQYLKSWFVYQYLNQSNTADLQKGDTAMLEFTNTIVYAEMVGNSSIDENNYNFTYTKRNFPKLNQKTVYWGKW